MRTHELIVACVRIKLIASHAFLYEADLVT